MVIFMTMIVVNINEAKAKLSEYVEAVSRGEQVLICNRNKPVAELRAVAPPRAAPRPVDSEAGFAVPDAFFEPLPTDELDAWLAGPQATPAYRVAEDPAVIPRAG